MTIDWKELEQQLYKLSDDALSSFAAQHPDEVFYGFIFDCNGDHGDVLLCLNTEELLQSWAKAHYPNYDSAEIDEQLRWNSGDWQYQGFNTDFDALSETFKAGWDPYRRAIFDKCCDEMDDVDYDDSPTVNSFLDSVCRVLIQMETENVFSCLKRTEMFKRVVSDHDDSLDDAVARLGRVRETFGI